MPFISIIIPTYNNEEHIEQAIDSCFDSDFDDFEIIVINDASTDGTAGKLELLINKYKRKLKVITSPNNNGLGETRNIGLKHAKGEYIMFLDGDDWFEPYAVKSVAEKLKKIEPDVLMFNHQRTWENGLKTPNLPNKYTNLKHEEKNITCLDSRKGAIKNLHSACNKSYRKTFITSSCVNFKKGYYEDFSWSIRAVIEAKKIYYIPLIAFNYRQRTGSITRSPSTKHFDIFKQIEASKKYLDEKKQNQYEKYIYEYTRSLVFGIIKTRHRIPKKQKRLFLKKSYQTLNAWRKKANINYFDLPLISLNTGNELLFLFIEKKFTKRN